MVKLNEIVREMINKRIDKMENRRNLEKNHTVVQLKDSNIKILIPDGYRKLKQKNPLKEIQSQIKKESVFFQKVVDYSDGYVCIGKLNPEKMLPSDEEDLIQGIHDCLDDNQGLIEVGAGYTKRGYRYIYSIVKTLIEDIMGVRYYLYMQMFSKETKENDFDAVEVAGDFTEIRMTGMRDSVGLDLARRAELISFENDDLFDGWNEDPYDPEYKNGALMNLSERAGLDALFPYHPLSQCRELLKAVLNDQIVLIERDKDGLDNNDESESIANGKSEKEMVLMLFNNEVDRYTYNVEITQNTSKQ